MKVVELTVHHIRIPLRRPIKHASHVRTSTDNVLARCLLDDGTEGFGEGVPREYVTGENLDLDLDLLRRSDLAAQMGPCRDFAAAVHLAERLRLAPVPGDDRGCRGNAARCAVELALLDAYGKRFGEPLSRATEIAAPELYAPRPAVRYSGAITSARGMKLRLLSWVLRAYGFDQVKVKVGIAGHDDAERLRVARGRLGARVDLRVDANEAWSRAEVVERIRALEAYGISSVEQPVAHADADVLAEVRRQVRVPIMLDESLCGMIDAEWAAGRGLCDLFNLRLSKCGGFLATLRLAQFARRRGLGCQLGCQVGETAVLSAAGRHFACSVGGLRYLEGSYDRHLVREPLAARDITFGWGGKAPALPGPGLGVTVDPKALERVTVRKEQLLG
ncbi:MAG TPA: enolase C-terminal domain-like protein [Gemmataceae bacterium]|nr:enolase C-terminal domain-like protein [Gemmataceae bacterium]